MANLVTYLSIGVPIYQRKTLRDLPAEIEAFEASIVEEVRLLEDIESMTIELTEVLVTIKTDKYDEDDAKLKLTKLASTSLAVAKLRILNELHYYKLKWMLWLIKGL